jgi:hypothetical protein
MVMITTPHNPMTDLNTEGYTQAQMDRLNEVYVEAWNYLFSDVELDGDDVWQRASSLWDAIGNTDGNITLVVNRMHWGH